MRDLCANTETRKDITEVLRWSVAISEDTDNEVHFQYFPHVMVSVKVYKGGWRVNKKPETEMESLYDITHGNDVHSIASCLREMYFRELGDRASVEITDAEALRVFAERHPADYIADGEINLKMIERALKCDIKVPGAELKIERRI